MITIKEATYIFNKYVLFKIDLYCEKVSHLSYIRGIILYLYARLRKVQVRMRYVKKVEIVEKKLSCLLYTSRCV